MPADSTISVPITMLIVFGAAKLLAEVCERLRQPAILGEICAGILIGPGVLHWVSPNAMLEVLAELGVIFLLFRVGLEVNPRELWAVRGTAMLVAILGVIVPLAAGWFFMRYWGAPFNESLFVGASMVATSVGVTAQVLGARGLLNQRASQIILAAAVIDDILGLIVLAVVSGVSHGHADLLSVLLTAVLALGCTALIGRWGPTAAHHGTRLMKDRLQAGEAQFNLGMVLLFALAALATQAGVAAIVGAFLAGLMLSETVETRVHDLTRGVYELLAPFFLAGIGLHFDPALFGDMHTLRLAAILFVLAVLGKVLGCGIGAIGLGRSEVVKIGLGMVPRGEVGMVVARYGLAAGIVSNPVYGAVVSMAVGTTLITPLLLRFAFVKETGPTGKTKPVTENAEWESI